MSDNWRRFNEHLWRSEAMGFALDVSRMGFPESFLHAMADPIAAAMKAMEELESGAIANPDEGRMVGHYWLRTPELAPTWEIRREIEETVARVREFASRVHAGDVAPAGGGRFTELLSIGIGGSALGPQLLADALGDPGQPLRPYFLDNTDPDGIDRTLQEIGDRLPQTLTVVMSKSGGTKETRCGMLEAEAAYERAGLSFGPHAVAVTGAGSELDRYAKAGEWLTTFPMWDWVGGRTSVCSAVGLVPGALLGFDMEGLLRGAREMDAATREGEPLRNPAALLALMWYYAGEGRGEKDMVVLPYKDRLQLFPRYLQQLVMESLGKELDLKGHRVNQGISVYGNKGSTDQHAYVQQLREGANNFFATFIEVLRDREAPSTEVEPGVTTGDYLHGFLQGTRTALAENGRESMTLTLDHLDAPALGRLIALYERAVGLYAGLIGINAYHQPGVEAGKKAAQRVIELQNSAIEALRAASGPLTAEEAASAAGAAGDAETIYHLLMHLAANRDRGVTRTSGELPFEDRFAMA